MDNIKALWLATWRQMKTPTWSLLSLVGALLASWWLGTGVALPFMLAWCVAGPITYMIRAWIGQHQRVIPSANDALHAWRIVAKKIDPMLFAWSFNCSWLYLCYAWLGLPGLFGAFLGIFILSPLIAFLREWHNQRRISRYITQGGWWKM